LMFCLGKYILTNKMACRPPAPQTTRSGGSRPSPPDPPGRGPRRHPKAGGLGGGSPSTGGGGGREPPRVKRGVWGAAAPREMTYSFNFSWSLHETAPCPLAGCRGASQSKNKRDGYRYYGALSIGKVSSLKTGTARTGNLRNSASEPLEGSQTNCWDGPATCRTT
jgi:hypothetical protein